MSLLNKDELVKAVNSNFDIQAEDKTIQLKLIECLDQTSNAMPDYERLSLLFESKGPLLAQASYSLNHPKIGHQELFLVPVHGDDNGFQYEAIINRKK